MVFTVLHRDINGKKLNFHNKLFSEVADIIKAELKSHHPVQPNEMVDKPVYTHDEMEHQLITRNNIIDTLIYNNFTKYYEDADGDLYYSKLNYQFIFHPNKLTCEFRNKGYILVFKSPNLDEVIEFMNKYCPLKPIPINKFDFVKYLLDNGFRENPNYKNNFIKGWVDIQITDGKFHTANKILRNYGLTEENAKTLVEMAKQGEKLI